MGAFIAKMLLPTVSSLVFLPTASVAAKRGFHMEAMVYFFTMFFTAVREHSRLWMERNLDPSGFFSGSDGGVSHLLLWKFSFAYDKMLVYCLVYRDNPASY